MRTQAIHIVLVEDNPLHRRLIERFLSRGGLPEHILESFPGLEPALKRLEQGGVDLVFLDLILPDSQGLETLARARACAPEVPIVVLTGLDDMDTAARALDAGAQDYVLKDKISPARLERAIRYVLARAHTRTGEWNAPGLRLGHQRFLKAAQMLQIDDALRQRLLSPQRARIVNFPFRPDTPGPDEGAIGYRLQHLNTLGPTMGGLYFSPALNLGQLSALAALSTWRFALLELPFGGAAGGIRLDPHRFSRAELQRIIRRYIIEISSDIGPRRDIIRLDAPSDRPELAPPKNSDLPRWVLDAYRQQSGQLEASVVTGKGALNGGIPRAQMLASRGLAQLIEEAAAQQKRPLDKMSCVIQRLTPASLETARALSARGARLLAAGLPGSALYRADGLDLQRLDRALHNIDEFHADPATETLSARDLFKLEVDILILSDPSAQFGVENAGKLQCKILVESTAGLLTPEADESLIERDILVLPDILTGAPHAICAYLEWLQSTRLEKLPDEALQERLKTRLDELSERVFKRAQREGTDLRSAAMILALERIIQTSVEQR